MVKKIILRERAQLCGLALAIALSGCVENEVVIEYTSYGVPHITANNLKSVTYGQGYAHAQENMCTLAEQIINIRAQRAQTFGAGDNDSNINKDFGVLALGIYQQAEASYDKLSQNHKDIISGYVTGFNKAVTEKGGAQNYPSPCRGESWVPEITDIDLHAYHLIVAMRSSGASLINDIAVAAPLQNVASLSVDLESITARNGAMGSNVWALGRDKTESGKGMLLANPHFYWEGQFKLIENHLKIPGEINITGVSFIGFPGVMQGFNEHVAWGHTVSASKRLTLYRLTLDPDNPTRYKYGQEYKDMSSTEYSIKVLNEDGSLSDVLRTLYSSHYGPMINWQPDGTAVTYRDAIAGSYQLVDQWLAMNSAKSIEEFEAAFETYQSMPWANTIATDKAGNALFIDGSRVANLDPFAEMLLENFLTNDPIGQSIWRGGLGQIIMDGSLPIFEWVDTGKTLTPGVVPFDEAPRALRSDYVFNANNSHWLTNVKEPLEGYSMVYGPERTVRSLRTRMNAIVLEDTSSDGASGTNGKFNLDELKNAMDSQRGLSSELLKDKIVNRCTGVTTITLEDQTMVDISQACNALTNWDGLYRNDSRGAHLFREFMEGFSVNIAGSLPADFFAESFDFKDPVNTPSGLASNVTESINDDPILKQLAITTQSLAHANIAPDARLGDLQYHMKNEEKIAIPGGNTIDGVINKNRNLSYEPGSFDYQVNHGASWVMALEFTEQGPKAEAILTYSQSHDPESEHFADQTRLYSEGGWRPVIFTEEDIKNDLVDTITLTASF